MCAVLPHDFRWPGRKASKDVAAESLRYVGGFILRTVRKKRPGKDFTLYEHAAEEGEAKSDFVSKLSRGGLIKISNWYHEELIKLNQLVNNYNGKTFNLGPGYLKHLRELTTTTSIDTDLINLFLRVKMFYRIKSLNRKILAARLARAKRRKANKFN